MAWIGVGSLRHAYVRDTLKTKHYEELLGSDEIWLMCNVKDSTVQIGYLILSTVYAIGWYYAGSARLAGLRRRGLGQSESLTVSQSPLPSLSILIPTAGGRSRVLQHWEALLNLQYSGAIQILILVHDKHDPSWPLAYRFHQHSSGRVKLLVTGHATSSSQKIHKYASAKETAVSPIT